MKNISTISSALMTVSLAFAGSPAQAQGSSSAINLLEEVLVTAQKREQSLQDVPIAVTALGADGLEQAGIRTLSDVSQLVPGLTITDTQSETTGISMRGISSNDFGFAVEQSIPVYLDGVYLGLGTSLMGDLTDIAQVEVLKGPQGTLFGRNAAGGAVSITTAPVEDDFSGELRAGFGNYDLTTAAGTINVPIIEGTLGIRINAGIRQRDGWQKNLISNKEDGYEQDRWYTRAKIAWTPTDAVSVEWSSDFKEEDDNSGYYYLLESDIPVSDYNPVVFDTEGTTAANGNFAIGSNVVAGESLNYRIEREIEGHAAKVSWDISEALTFTSISSYRTLEYAIDEDNDGTEFLLLNVRSFMDAEEYSQEFRINGNTDALDWFVGASAYGQKSEGSVTDSFGSFLVGAAVTEVNIVESEVESYGLFGDVIWAATDKINLTVGARYSYDEKTQDILTPNQDTLGLGFNLVFPSVGQLTDVNGTPDPTLANLKSDWDDFSLRSVIDYRVNDDSMVFFSVSQGYKSGGFNSFPIVDLGEFFPLTTPGQLEPYDEEKVTSYELGIKSELMERRLRLNASVFYYDWDDLQVQITRDKALFTINAGKAIGKGADVELTFQATENLVFTANLGWLSAKYDEDVPGSDIRDGDELLYSPEFASTLGVDYTVFLGDELELRTNMSYSYNGDQYLSSTTEENSYSLFNARVSLLSSSDTWEVALWGRNLTDESYLDTVSDFSEIGYISARRNEPRTYGAEVIYRF